MKLVLLSLGCFATGTILSLSADGVEGLLTGIAVAILGFVGGFYVGRWPRKRKR